MAAVACGLSCSAATNSEAPAAIGSATSSSNAASLEADALLRSVLILQEQLKTTQREIAQARQDAEAASHRTTELLTERLNFIEQKQVDDMQRSHQLTLAIVGIIAGIAVLSVILSGWLQMRAVTRLGHIARKLDTLPELMAGSFKQIGQGESVQPTQAAQLSAGQISSNLSRLHDRLDDLAATANGSNGFTIKELPPAHNRVATSIAKGQTLLNLEQPEAALASFEEALSIDPKSIEGWVKKGSALERLQRVDEAIAAYDQAIALDESTATAYLFKAGVFNRQKRYAEALECYEKALSVQKSRAAKAA